MSKRLARLSEQLKRELSELIRLEVRDPRVGSVTITDVEVAADLGSARVYVRSVEGGEALARSLEGLHAAAPFLRTALGKRLHVRRVPELRFREDRSYAGAQRIEEVLAEVLPEDQESSDASSEPGPGGASGPASDDEGAREAGADQE
jgi:ribosome-binding factor A